MPDLEEQVRQAREAVADAARKRAEAEARREVAAEQLAEATRTLAREFGVVPERAEQVEAELEAAVRAECQAVTDALEEAGYGGLD